MDDVAELVKQTRRRLAVAGEAVRDIDRQLRCSSSHGVGTAIDIALAQLELADLLARKTLQLFHYRTQQGYSLPALEGEADE